MAKKEDRKKQKKREKERQKARATAKHLAEKAKAERYPEIVFDPTEGNGYFVAEVRAVVKDLDFDSPEMGPDWMREFYRQYRAEGLQAALRRVDDLEEKAQRRIIRTGIEPAIDDFPTRNHVAMHLGECIFSKLSDETRRRFLPMNDFSLEFEQAKIVLRFTSLLDEPGDWGIVYYSRLLPKIEAAGKRVTVAFSDHAIEQLCVRRTPRYRTFSGNGDAHAYLSRCVYHEPVVLTNGSPAIRLWDLCDVDGFRVYRDYVLDIFGEENRKLYGGRCHYILGYCPFVLENGFAKAKSFLYPGFRGTPERALLNRADEQQIRYEKWLEEAEDDEAEPFFETSKAVEVAKWFHTHGVPQVVQMKQDVMKQPARPSSSRPRLTYVLASHESLD